MAEVRVAIVGVGNCASALVQGVEHYRLWPDDVGLMSPVIGGLRPGDINFVAGFDVNETKVGLDLSHAIFAKPNNTRVFAEVPYKDVTVVAGPLVDGLGKTASSVVRPVSAQEDVAAHLRATRTDVVVNFLPVGSENASLRYALAALDAGCSFVNAIPTTIARNPGIADAFEDAGLQIIGDDVKSQLGATIVHRLLVQAFAQRGVELERTYQLNVGGNLDFLNMLDQDRLKGKRESKTTAVTSSANSGRGLKPDDVHIGPSDYVPWLGDRKVALMRLEGVAFGGAPLELDVRMEVWDSPNSAGVVIDAVRYVMAAREAGRAGVLAPESAWLMKAPPVQMPESDAWHVLQPLVDDSGSIESTGPQGGVAGDAAEAQQMEAE